jgi:hypothetical protein
MSPKLFVLASPLTVALLVGCNRTASESGPVTPETNGVITNLMSPESAATNDLYTNSTATHLAIAGGGAWQSTKEAGSNVWQETKETSTNLWDKTKAAFLGDDGTNGIATNYFGYNYSMKDSFVAGARSSLDALDSRIASLSSKAGNSVGAMPDFQQAMQLVKDKRAELGNKYEDMKNANAESWDNAKAAYAKSYFDLKASMKAAYDSAKASL